MPFRFGKSIRLGKHIRLNVSKSGVGVSAGVRGARISTGPRGTRLSSSIPGTGLSYSKQLGSRSTGRQQSRQAPPVVVPKPPTPGFLAQKHEKEFFKAIEDYREGRLEAARDHFLAAASKEPSAAIFAASALMNAGQLDRSAQLLESVIQSDAEFPTPLMQKYLSGATLKIDVTESVEATVPVDGLGATLLLVEVYQSQGRLDEAIGLLEEIEEVAGEPVVTLSLCDLYAAKGLWDGIVERAKQTVVEDDTTLEIAVLYGRAMQAKNLHDAAISVFTEALKKRKDRYQGLINEALYWRAISYEATGKKSQASKEFQKLYADVPDFRDVARRVQQ